MNRKKLIILGSLVAIYFLTLGILLRYSDKSTCPVTNVNTVSVTLGTDLTVDVSGSNYLRALGKSLKRDEDLIVSFTLPNTDNMIIPAIEFNTDECAYEVYVGDKLIEQKYLDEIARNTYISSGHNLISLPENSSGETLKIILRTSSLTVVNPISSISVGNRLDLFKRYVFSNALPLFLGLFLILYGAIFLMISLILFGWVDGLKINILESCICMDLGVFLHTYYKCAGIYMSMDLIKPIMYTTMAAIMPLSIMLCFEISKGALYEKKHKIVTAYNIMFVFINILHYAGMISFYYTKWVIYVFLVACFVGIVIKYIKDKKNGLLDDGDIFQIAGLITLSSLLFASSLINMATRFLNIDSNSVIIYIGGNLVSVGALLFAYFQLANFYINVTGAYARTVEFESLAYLAYADGLTGLYNRSKLNLQLEEWESNEENYCIISFDLNGLKMVNDNYGHNAGDELLKVFGKALQSVFEGYDAMVGRIGGDEFMVIMRKVGTEEVEQALRMLDAKLEVINTVKDVPWDYSTAYGYGFRVECKEDFIHQTYLLADQRMYEAKKEHHEKYRIKSR